MLLLAGFAVGPILGVIDPDALLGELLFPFVSVSVAIILFEGGLSLRLSEIRDTTDVVGRLVTVGAGVTWLLAAGAAGLLLDVPTNLALLLGAVLVVTGPTVVLPLVRHVRPSPRVASVLKWEGIVIDPVGALLAVLVFEAVVAAGVGEATSAVVTGLAATVAAASVLGVLGAFALAIPLRRFWIPEHLEVVIALAIVVGVFALTNLVHPEAGLLTVTLMGIALANQRGVNVRHIVEFKEHLRTLFLAALFILLAARLELGDLWPPQPAGIAFAAVLVLVVRPLAVAVSTFRSKLDVRERAFVAWMAPRGIVAAAVASVFALELEHAGVPDADRLVSITFLVIVTTVVLYGLTAEPVARLLRVADPDAGGALILGAHAWARELAAVLSAEGASVLLADRNPDNAAAARLAGLRVYQGDILAEYAMEEIPFERLGQFLALTSNSEVNSLAALHMAEVFGRTNVHQLPGPAYAAGDTEEPVPAHLRGRLLFGPGVTYDFVRTRLAAGAVFQAVRLGRERSYEDFRRQSGDSAVPLLVVRPSGRLSAIVSGETPVVRPDDVLVALVSSRSGESEAPAAQAEPATA